VRASGKRYITIYLSFLLIGVVLFVAIKLLEWTVDKSEQPQQKISQHMTTPEKSGASANFRDNSFESMSYEEQIYSSEVQKDEELIPEKKETPQLEQQAQRDTELLIADTVFNILSNQSTHDQGLETGPEKNLKIVSDGNLPLQHRIRAAWSLATLGDDAALSGLKEVLLQEETPSQLKAIILEGLGYSEEPQAKQMILSSLADGDDTTVRGAIRGLAVVGDEDSVSILSDIMLSGEYSRGVAAEAAMGLGKIDDPGIYDTLVDAFHAATDSGNDELREGIILALGQRDIKETSGFLESILDDGGSDNSLKVAAVEAVEEAQGDTIPFLLNNLYHQNSEVRASAAWALAVEDEPGDISEEIREVLTVEREPEVRKRLYQALSNQEIEDIDSIAEIVFAESDLDARLAGYDLLAEHIGNSDDADLIEMFAEVAIPELQETALTANTLSSRLSAVISLKRANTEESSLALEEIIVQSSDVSVLEAINNLD